ncbi:hypothetical protein CA13_07760 [Planctomycetes bacterium CA13]|uniref:Glycosyltransferase RgtA/B/C/D-like domain-containing protein n=2 Tax=Novipirellula herctigrandis TaxID=2527986 RepID=A0A5C5YX69_9BACT|nr:hypothetical protein CA13_07760 [Planctomycetes bacterium CA13]
MLVGFVVAGVVVAAFTGRLEMHLVADSASYLDYSFASLDAMSRSIRTPGYPLWLAFWQTTIGVEWVPTGQVIVHAIACGWFAIELRRLGMNTTSAVIAGVAVGIGCTAMDNINCISTDALAASAGVMVACSLLRCCGSTPSVRWTFVTVTLATVAIMLRPAYLFLIPWLFVAGTLLRMIRLGDFRTSALKSLTLSVMTVVPLVAWMLIRLWVVSDFAVLPFGHQNLAGVLVQLLSDEELNQLSGEAGEMGRATVEAKQSFLDGGGRFAEPSYGGERGETMRIDQSWDKMTYFVVVPASKSFGDNDRVAAHQRVATMNKAIVRAYPVRYAIWIAKNIRRGAWAISADIVMHPVFLVAIVLAMGWAVYHATVSGTACDSLDPTIAMRSLAVIAVTYVVMNLGFVSLTSPAIGRFSDAAAIFLPAWLAVMAKRR